MGIRTDQLPSYVGAAPLGRDATEEDTMTESKQTKKAAAVKPEFAPKVTDKGRLDHTACGHPRTLAGRSACRANHAKAAETK